MRHILDRLLSYDDYSIVIFGDKTILDEGKRAAPLMTPWTDRVL